jgi:predicted nucleic acid-binding protein
MEAVILDTDVVSFIAKNDSRAALYITALTGTRVCICFQTVAELRLWALLRHWGLARLQELESLLDQYVVLPYDLPMAQPWAEVTAHRRGLGRPIDCGDAWIAACAIRHGATLHTHNAKDYAEIPGLTVISRRR